MYQFNPRFSDKQTIGYMDNYYRNPRKFNQQQVQMLANHARFYGIDFEPIDEEELKFKPFRAVKQFAEGYLSGFTTLNIGEESQNPIERVLRSAGQAMGFIGFIPHFGIKSLKLASQAVRGKSVPLLVTGAIQKKVNPVVAKAVATLASGKNQTLASAAKFAMSPIPADVISGTAKLAMTGAISQWQNGIDGMLAGLVGGGYMEFGDRIIANTLTMGTAGQNAIMRTIAGALWNGLPSSVRKETLPEQVYDYLTGGLFAYNDIPAYERIAQKMIFDMKKTNVKIPEAMEGFKDLSDKGKSTVKKMVEFELGTPDLLKQMTGSVLAKLEQKNMQDSQRLTEDNRALTGIWKLDYKLINDEAFMYDYIQKLPLSDKSKSEVGELYKGFKNSTSNVDFKDIIKYKLHDNKELIDRLNTPVSEYENNIRESIVEEHSAMAKQRDDIVKQINEIDAKLKTNQITEEEAKIQTEERFELIKRIEETPRMYKIDTKLIPKKVEETKELANISEKAEDIVDKAIYPELVKTLETKLEAPELSQLASQLKQINPDINLDDIYTDIMDKTNNISFDKINNEYNQAIDDNFNRNPKINELLKMTKASVITPNKIDGADVKTPDILRTKKDIMFIYDPLMDDPAFNRDVQFDVNMIKDKVNSDKPSNIITLDLFEGQGLKQYTAISDMLTELGYEDKASGVWVKSNADNLNRQRIIALQQQLHSEYDESTRRNVMQVPFNNTFSIAKSLYEQEGVSPDKIDWLSSSAAVKLEKDLYNKNLTPKQMLERAKFKIQEDRQDTQVKQLANLKKQALENKNHITWIYDKGQFKPIQKGYGNLKDVIVSPSRAFEKSLQDVYGDDSQIITHFEYVYATENTRKRIGDDGLDLSAPDFADVTDTWLKNGYIMMSQGGDSQRLYASRIHPMLASSVGFTVKNNQYSYNKEKLNEMYDNMLVNKETAYKKYNPEDAKKIDINKQYGEDYLMFKDYIRKKFIPFFGKDAKEIDEITLDYYKLSTVNNELVFKEALGYKDYDDYFAGNFLYKAKDFNKRLNVLMNSGVDAVAKGNKVEENNFYNRFVYAHKKIHGTDTTLTKDQLLNPEFIIYKEKDHKNTATDDGNIWVTKEFMDALNYQTGIKGTYYNKSVIVSKNEEFGTLLGKFAFHVPTDPRFLKIMKDQNLQMVMGSNAVKMLGHRKTSDIFTPGSEMYRYKLNMSDIKVNLSLSANPHMIDNSKLPRQIFTTPRFTDYIDKQGNVYTKEEQYKNHKNMLETLSAESSQGDIELNRKYKEALISNDSEGMLKAVEKIHDLSIDNIAHIFTESDNKIKLKAAQALLRSEDAFNEKEMPEYEDAVSLEKETVTGQKEIKDIILKSDSPSLMLNPKVKEFLDPIIRKHIEKRLLRPGSGNSISGLLIGSPSGDIVNDNETILGGGYRTKRITYFNGEKVVTDTLENILFKYNREKNPKKKEYLGNALDMLAVRVPMDHITGAQKVRVKGFTDDNVKLRLDSLRGTNEDREFNISELNYLANLIKKLQDPEKADQLSEREQSLVNKIDLLQDKNSAKFMLSEIEDKLKWHTDSQRYDMLFSGFVKEMLGGADDDGDKAFGFFGGRVQDDKAIRDMPKETIGKPSIEMKTSDINKDVYVGGFENVGKGTPTGDGKDKAMRQVADGFIGEIIKDKSSSATSKKEIENKIVSAKGKMTFAYGNNKRNDIKSSTTFEAIKNGERTATTRYESDRHIDYWKKLKEGDIIQWEGATGNKVLVRVTKPLHKLISSGKTAEQWSKLEGWSVEYFNSKVKPKLNEAWQIEYEILQNNIIMLARNSEFKGKDLKPETKQQILDAYNKGAKFVVGDMPNVDSQFIDYLNEIGGDYKIYHTGDNPRIQIDVNKPETQTKTKSTYKGKGLTQEWMDIYHKRKEQRTDNEGNVTPFLTEDLEKELTGSDPLTSEIMKSMALTSAPGRLLTVGESAANARRLLGEVANNASKFIALANDATFNHNGIIKGKYSDIIVKNNNLDVEKFLNTFGSEMKITVDPMDFDKVSNREVFYRTLFNSLFEIKDKKGKIYKNPSYEIIRGVLKTTQFKELSEVQSTIFSKNFETGEKYSTYSIKNAIDNYNAISTGETTNVFQHLSRNYPSIDKTFNTEQLIDKRIKSIVSSEYNYNTYKSNPIEQAKLNILNTFSWATQNIKDVNVLTLEELASRNQLMRLLGKDLHLDSKNKAGETVRITGFEGDKATPKMLANIQKRLLNLNKIATGIKEKYRVIVLSRDETALANFVKNIDLYKSEHLSKQESLILDNMILSSNSYKDIFFLDGKRKIPLVVDNKRQRVSPEVLNKIKNSSSNNYEFYNKTNRVDPFAKNSFLVSNDILETFYKEIDSIIDKGNQAKAKELKTEIDKIKKQSMTEAYIESYKSTIFDQTKDLFSSMSPKEQIAHKEAITSENQKERYKPATQPIKAKISDKKEFLEKVSKPSVIPDEPTIIKDAYDILTSDKEPSKIDKQLLQEKKSLETRLKDMELNLTNLKDRIRNASIKVKQANIDKYKTMDIDDINEMADKLISSITNHLADYKIQPGHLNLMARSMLNKELDAMDLSDWQKFDNMFSEMRNPSFLQRMRGLVKDKSPLLSKAHYFMFPEHIDKDLLSKNIDFFNEKTLYFDKDGNIKEGWGMKPMSVQGKLQNAIYETESKKIKMQETLRSQFTQEMYPYTKNEFGRDLTEFAIIERERKLILNELNKNPEDIVVQARMEDYDKQTRDRYKSLLANLKDKEFSVIFGDKASKMSLKEITENINNIFTKYNETISILQRGKRDENGELLAIKKYRLPDKTYIDIKGKIKSLPSYDIDQILKEFNTAIYQNKSLNTDIGIDGLNEISQMILADDLYKVYKKTGNKKFLELMDYVSNQKQVETGAFNYEGYFPHLRGEYTKEDMQADIVKVTNQYKTLAESFYNKYEKKIEEIFEYSYKFKDDLNYQEYKEQYIYLKKHMNSIVQRGANRGLNDELVDSLLKPEITSAMETLLRKASNAKEHENAAVVTQQIKDLVDIALLNVSGKTESMKTREADDWTNYSKSLDTYTQYMDAQINAFHKKAALLQANHLINEFRIKNAGESLDFTEPWTEFFRMYVNDSLAYPAVIADALKADKRMKLDYNSYYALSDGVLREKFYNWGVKLGLIKKPNDIPAELASTVEELLKPSYGAIIRLSHLEAQYQLLTLLTHTKSTITNLYGGNVQTAASAGLVNWKRANDINYLKSKMNPNWNSMKDVDDFVRKQGIIEEYLLSEAGTTGKYGERWKNFVEDAIKKISANPDMDDKSLRQLAKEYKISDALFDKAGWFMRVPERYNRKVAYIAHYLQAQELFGNVLPEYDANGEYKGHPYLHHLAKKGVENTQYFYSASYRPAFSRTAFGKVLTRFQLYPMNTLKYRKNLYDEAKMHGLNSEQGERFSRFIIMDTISLALSAAFAYTLFDYALPSPYTYFQDIANFMFGDEEEKRKAFFGGYPYPLNPLQIITPPALRMFPGLVTGMISNDWRGVVGYQAWTMFPFGRMARDINKTYKDPNKAVDYMLGLPLSRLRNDSEREKEKVANKQKTAYTISGIL